MRGGSADSGLRITKIKRSSQVSCSVSIQKAYEYKNAYTAFLALVSTPSFYLRDSAVLPPCTFGTHLRGILQSRIHFRSLSFRTPERFTPSVGFRRSPGKFRLPLLSCGFTVARLFLIVNGSFAKIRNVQKCSVFS